MQLIIRRFVFDGFIFVGMRFFPALFILLSIFLHYSCKKDSFINTPDARVSYSADSIYFDTLISNTGSVTKAFKIFNLNDQKLRISSIALAGGSSSSFKININGQPAVEAGNIEVDANDSIYVFVSVFPKASGSDQPFITEDSISIKYNGNTNWIRLSAWGQDAVFLKDHRLSADEVWTNERPYVIIGGLEVPAGKKLSIQKGTKVYCRANAPLIIDGRLEVLGEYYDSMHVVFRSDRLDAPYKDHPGSWPGIIIRNGSALIKSAEIRNAYQGIVTSAAVIEIRESIIDNCFDAGILSVNSVIDAQNTLITNCGKGVILANGGEYKFVHCTFAGVSNNYILHKEPSLVITDFVRDGNTVYTNDVKVELTNSIVWGANGTVDNEVVLNRTSNKSWQISFQNNVIKNSIQLEGINSVANLFNIDPEFEEISSEKRIFNFRLKENSAILDKGKPTSISIDIEGKNRSASTPDPGVYERN